ncbi:MAG TPA: NADH-quinone oxidoreductase subunit N [Nitrospiraceae bacterium]|nr:NADH-quinone oxidoreductase subunit N [Nitrospiraceae bacterium]
MVRADVIALAPLLAPASTAVVVMLLSAFLRRHAVAAAATAGGLCGGLLLLPVAGLTVPRAISPVMVVDSYGLFYLGLILSAGLFVTGLSYGYLGLLADEREEYYSLLLLATLGGCVLIVASHFASFFLGLELLSVSLYGLIAYPRSRPRSLEAGIKYLILSSVSSALLLFGMGLIYHETGSMALSQFAETANAATASPARLIGRTMILAGLGFKLAVVPFHMWAPDVYQGSPAPITAFVATVSKAAVAGFLLRHSPDGHVLGEPVLWPIVAVVALLSMFVGNLLALLQQDVKRILAYSSIAHLGYLLVAFLVAGPFATEAVTLYLVAYVVTMLGAFAVVTVLSSVGGDADSIEEYRGLFWRRPWLGGCFTVILLSLAGIPVTAGFIGKFYVIAAGVDAKLWLLVIMLVINSVIGLFYYLRIIIAMTGGGMEAAKSGAGQPAYWSIGGWSLAAATLLVLWIGLNPEPLIRVVRSMVVGVSQ